MPTAARKAVTKVVPSTLRALVVLGMHRSGTSAATRVLALSGADLPKGLMAPHADNPAGFWESQPVTDLNDEILQELGSNWEDVFAFRLGGNLDQSESAYVDRAVKLLTQEFNGSELVVLKDPRISVLAPLWERALREAGYVTHYVVMVRNPLEVAESLRVRDGFSLGMSLLLWSSYMIAAERDTRDQERTFVSYDQLMNDWHAVRRRIEEASGMSFPRATGSAADDVDNFLDQGLRHHKSQPKDLFARDDVPEHVKTLYRVLFAACEGEKIDPAMVDAVEARLADAELLIGPALASLRSRARSLADDVAELNGAHAGARGQADTLAQQLEEERANRKEEAEAAARAADEQNRHVAELGGRLTELEAERERLLAEAQAEHKRLLAESHAERERLLAAAQSEHERLLAEANAERARGKAREVEFRALVKESENMRAALAVAESNMAQFARDLDVAEAEFETKLRTVELSADRRVAHIEAEYAGLAARADADRIRADGREIELAAERQQATHLRRMLSTAEAKLIRFEQTLDEIEDEVEETIRKVDMRVEQALAASEIRLRQEILQREELEKLHAESLAAAEAQHVQTVAAVETRYAQAAAEVESGRAEMEALRAELAQVTGSLAKVRASMSWRLTTPFRRTASWFRARST